MNFIDILIIGIIMLGALHGYRKGLITGVANFIGTILGFILAAAAYNPVGQWLTTSTPLKGWIEPWVYRSALPFVESQASGLQQNVIDKMLNFIPDGWSSLLSGNLNGVQVIPQASLEKIAHAFAESVTKNIITVLAFIAVFLTVVIVIQIVTAIVLKPFGIFGGVLNSGGGLAFGALASILTLSIIIGLFDPLLQLVAQTSGTSMIQEALFYAPLLSIFHGLEQIFAAQLSSGLFKQLIPNTGDILKEIGL